MANQRHKASYKSKISYYKKPVELTIEDWQRALRLQWAQDEKVKPFRISGLGGEHPVYMDYTVENPASGGVYKVALRSREPGSNFCTCLDFKTNTLGVCKHIEAVLHRVLGNKKTAKLLMDDYKPAYTSMFIRYGLKREVMLRIGTERKSAYEKLATEYFDRNGHLLPDAFERIDRFIAEANRLSSDFRCYPDAMDFIIQLRERRVRQMRIDRKIGNAKSAYFNHLLNATLYPYQKEGILFAARTGRCLIADDMGLGKTLQAIGAAELFKKEFGITSVLIVCPTSLKYQWKSEIEKFSRKSGVTVIEGNALQREKQYRMSSFYKIASYHAVGVDIAAVKKMGLDLVILDEAQRIKNWKTKIAKEIKKIESAYALVLTGTPIENKLEELYSIIQFIDPYALGPLYVFLETHQIRDESGKIVGYRELHGIQKLLSNIVIRRTKKDVLAQLPERTDKQLFVPLTQKQTEIHQEYADGAARLVNKWKRFGFLDEKDRRRLLLGLNCMRMVADSTYILDQESRHDNKITELMSILEKVLTIAGEKAVVFSQWERMTRLVKMELEIRKVGFAYLHGGVLSHKRKSLLDNFRQDPACRVFLSTDAGGVGLNLQRASTLINLDLPWNPAVLEQRIGRIHRHGQLHPVNIINFISRGSIEERMLSVLKFKSSLFAGVLDDGEDQIFMGENKFKRFMASVEKITQASKAEPTPVTDVEDYVEEQQAFALTAVDTDKQKETSETTIVPAVDIPLPARELFGAVESFFDTLAKTFADPQKTQDLFSSLVQTDLQTRKKYLKIPIENEQIIVKAAEVLTGFLEVFKK